MNLAAILAALGPMVEPVILQEWNTQVLPFLNGLVAKITQPDEQLAAQALVVFLDTIAQAEIKKI